MRATLPVSILKRLEALECKQGANRPVAMLPPLLSVNAWGDLAAPMQRILKDNVVKDTAPDYGDLPQIEFMASR